MSSNFSPYVPPSVVPGVGEADDLLKPARRASTMMFVLGPIFILLSGCLLGTALLFPYMPAEQLQQFREKVNSISQVPPELLLRILGGVLLVVGICLCLLGVFVRKGGFVSIVLSIVLVGLMVLQQVPSLILSLFAVNTAIGLGNFLGNGLVFSAFLLLLIWLIGAARAIPKIRMAHQQYMAQYWQSQQNSQARIGYPTQVPTAQQQVATPTSNQPSS